MKKYLAELIGTFTLVLFGCGTAVVASAQVGVLGISFAFGFALIAMAYGIGPISGCHINPAVSLGVFVAGWMKMKELVGYIVSQCLGAIVAAGILSMIMKAKMAGYPCALVALKAEGDDESFEATREMLREQLREEDLVTLLPNDTFLMFLGQGGAPEARQFVARLAAVASGRVGQHVTHLRYAVASYPRDGADADTLIQATSNKLLDEPERGTV